MITMDPFQSLPNFMILGAAKAGTTTLFNLMKQHPQVHMPFTKEPMFFSHDDNYRRGLDWYRRTYFRKAGTCPVRGEATPHYLYWSEKVAERIRQAYQGRTIRFVVIFRDPVDRAYSWYWNMVREGREDLPFEAALEAEPRRLQENASRLRRTGSMTYGYARGSCYASALKPFLDLFPRQDFHFLIQEDLNRDFSHALPRLMKFLDLDAGITLRQMTSNPATMPRNPRLQSLLQRQSDIREILKALIPLRLRYAIKTRLLSANARPMPYHELDAGLEASLRSQLAPEIRRLEAMIGRDLSAWLPQP